MNLFSFLKFCNTFVDRSGTIFVIPSFDACVLSFRVMFGFRATCRCSFQAHLTILSAPACGRRRARLAGLPTPLYTRATGALSC